MNLTVFIPGIPAPQGSKTPWGTEANPNTWPWRDSIKSVLLSEYKGKLLHGPVRVELTFIFPRPKAHYNSKGLLKENSAYWKNTKPDLDKLCRAVFDAVTDAGNVWHDDCQVVSLAAEKMFVKPESMHFKTPGLALLIEETCS